MILIHNINLQPSGSMSGSYSLSDNQSHVTPNFSQPVALYNVSASLISELFGVSGTIQYINGIPLSNFLFSLTIMDRDQIPNFGSGSH